MAREERKRSCTGVYHVMLRGINKQVIFHDDEDRRKFLEILCKYKSICGYSIFSYCLMSNHIHLLIKEGIEAVSLAIKRIGVCYVHWYNKKYDRNGHLFQDRFRSENVEDEPYLLVVLRYIHQNPIKAGMVQRPDQYIWSSYNAYINHDDELTDTRFILEILSSDSMKSVEMYINFMAAQNDDKCLEDEYSKRSIMADGEVITIIKHLADLEDPRDLQDLRKESRNDIIKKLRELIPIRQLSRITGIGRNVIQRL